MRVTNNILVHRAKIQIGTPVEILLWKTDPARFLRLTGRMTGPKKKKKRGPATFLSYLCQSFMTNYDNTRKPTTIINSKQQLAEASDTTAVLNSNERCTQKAEDSTNILLLLVEFLLLNVFIILRSSDNRSSYYTTVTVVAINTV